MDSGRRSSRRASRLPQRFREEPVVAVEEDSASSASQEEEEEEEEEEELQKRRSPRKKQRRTPKTKATTNTQSRRNNSNTTTTRKRSSNQKHRVQRRQRPRRQQQKRKESTSESSSSSSEEEEEESGEESDSSSSSSSSSSSDKATRAQAQDLASILGDGDNDMLQSQMDSLGLRSLLMGPYSGNVVMGMRKRNRTRRTRPSLPARPLTDAGLPTPQRHVGAAAAAGREGGGGGGGGGGQVDEMVTPQSSSGKRQSHSARRIEAPSSSSTMQPTSPAPATATRETGPELSRLGAASLAAEAAQGGSESVQVRDIFDVIEELAIEREEELRAEAEALSTAAVASAAAVTASPTRGRKRKRKDSISAQDPDQQQGSSSSSDDGSDDDDDQGDDSEDNVSAGESNKASGYSRTRTRAAASAAAAAGSLGEEFQQFDILADLSAIREDDRKRQRGAYADKRTGWGQASKLPPAMEVKLGKANSAFLDGDHVTAIKLLEEIIQRAPEAPGPFLTLGVIHEQAGDLRNAVSAFLIAAQIRRREATIDEWIRIFELAEKCNDLHSQAICLGRICRLSDNPASWLSKRAEVRFQMGDYGRLFDSCKALASAGVSSSRIVFYDACLSCHTSSNGINTAVVNLYDKIKVWMADLVRDKSNVSFFPDLSIFGLFVRLANYVDNNDRTIHVVEQLRKAWSFVPWSKGGSVPFPMELVAHEGIAYAALGRKADADAIFDQVLSQPQEGASATMINMLVRLSDAFFKLGMFMRAIQTLKLLNLPPRAASDSEQARPISRVEIAVWIRIGVAHRMAMLLRLPDANSQDALAYLNAVLKHEPDNALVAYEVAQTMQLLDRQDEIPGVFQAPFADPPDPFGLPVTLGVHPTQLIRQYSPASAFLQCFRTDGMPSISFPLLEMEYHPQLSSHDQALVSQATNNAASNAKYWESWTDVIRAHAAIIQLIYSGQFQKCVDQYLPIAFATQKMVEVRILPQTRAEKQKQKKSSRPSKSKSKAKGGRGRKGNGADGDQLSRAAKSVVHFETRELRPDLQFRGRITFHFSRYFVLSTLGLSIFFHLSHALVRLGRATEAVQLLSNVQSFVTSRTKRYVPRVLQIQVADAQFYRLCLSQICAIAGNYGGAAETLSQFLNGPDSSVAAFPGIGTMARNVLSPLRFFPYRSRAYNAIAYKLLNLNVYPLSALMPRFNAASRKFKLALTEVLQTSAAGDDGGGGGTTASEQASGSSGAGSSSSSSGPQSLFQKAIYLDMFIGTTLIDFADSYKKQPNYRSYLLYCGFSYLFECQKLTHGHPFVLHNLGVAFQKVGNIPLAIKYHELCIASSEQILESFSGSQMQYNYDANLQLSLTANYKDTAADLARIIKDAAMGLGLIYRRAGHRDKEEAIVSKYLTF